MQANRINEWLSVLSNDDRKVFEWYGFDKGVLDLSLNRGIAAEDQLKLMLTVAKYCKDTAWIIEVIQTNEKEWEIIASEKRGLLRADSPILTVWFWASDLQPHQWMSAYVLPPVEILRHAKRIWLETAVLYITDATHFSNGINKIMSHEEANKIIAVRKDFIAQDLEEHLGELWDQVQFIATPNYSEEVEDLVELIGEEALELVSEEKAFKWLVKSSERHCKNQEDAELSALRYLLGHLFVFWEVGGLEDSDLRIKFWWECEKWFSKLQGQIIDLLWQKDDSHKIRLHPNIRRVEYRKTIGKTPPYYMQQATPWEIEAVEATRVH